MLAAGLGTRLRPLTLDRAKPALPVAGPSLIERIVRWLAGHGVTDLIVNLHYRPETISHLQICTVLQDAGFRASTFQDSASGKTGVSSQ